MNLLPRKLTGSIPSAITSDRVMPATPLRWNDAITLREVSFRYPGASRPACASSATIS